MKSHAWVLLIPFVSMVVACSSESGMIAENPFESVADSVVFVEGDSGTGSGVVIDGGKHVVTNYHVVAGSASVHVTLPNNTRVEVKPIGFRRRADIAVLELPNSSIGAVKAIRVANASSLTIGDQVFAIGYPLEGGSDAPILQMTVGIVSAARPDLFDDVEYVQTDALLMHGISGGALVNDDGELIGMPTRGVDVSAAGGLAIAAEDVTRIATDIVDGASDQQPIAAEAATVVNGSVERPYGVLAYYLYAREGDEFLATVRSDADVSVSLYDGVGTEVEFVDDAEGTGQERIEHKIEREGPYQLLISSAVEQQGLRVYVTSSLQLHKFLDEEEGRHISARAPLAGELQYSGDEDVLLLSLSAGDQLSISGRSWEFDVFMTVETPSGELMEDDDSGLGINATDANVELTAQDGGYYRVILSASDYGFGFYHVTVEDDPK